MAANYMEDDENDLYSFNQRDPELDIYPDQGSASTFGNVNNPFIRPAPMSFQPPPTQSIGNISAQTRGLGNNNPWMQSSAGLNNEEQQQRPMTSVVPAGYTADHEKRNSVLSENFPSRF